MNDEIERAQFEEKLAKYLRPSWRQAFNDRQRKKIDDCALYAEIVGQDTEVHLLRMIIARMAELLDGMEGRVS